MARLGTFAGWLLVMAGCWLGCAGENDRPASSAQQRPNILFILTDDQGIGDLSLHGNDSLDTPHTDRLLLESTRFTRFYVDPVCAPTRAAFLSGRYPQRSGALFVTRRAETMSDSVLTIAEILAANGYRTGLFGKWHNGATYPFNPPGQGFQEFLGFSMGHYNSYYDDRLENESGAQVPFSGYLTDVLTDTATAFMLEATTPFFCMLTLQAPHTPVQAPDSLYAKYLDRGLTAYNAGIYAMIEANDLAIGRLLDSLRSYNLLENTVVVFSTDNGPNGDRFNRGLKGRKGQVDEGGVRVPFAIRFGLRSSQVFDVSKVDHPAAHIDLLPTLLDLIDVDYPSASRPLDGISLLPYLESPGSKAADRNIYVVKQGLPFVSYPGGFRNERYLYLLRRPGTHELYDLLIDSAQTTNLFDSTQAAHRELADEYAAFTSDLAREDLVAPPIQIGHEAVKELRLLAHEGEPIGKARFHDRYGWANDWVENISLFQDGISWPVEVIEAGRYRFRLAYATRLHQRPVALKLTAGDQQAVVEAPVFENHDLPTRDLVERKEVYPRNWNIVTGSILIEDETENIRLSPQINSKGELLIKSLVLVRE